MKKSLGAIVVITVGAILIATFITTGYASAGEKSSDGRFIAYNNGTVLDTKTKLIWAVKDNGTDINWADAKSYCKNYRAGGYKNWRMPTQDELAGLYDSGKSYKATQRDYDVHLTKLIQLSSCCPWASETRGSAAAIFCFDVGRRYFLTPGTHDKNYPAGKEYSQQHP
jgi:Protein of unknown function (DUF1566)